MSADSSAVTQSRREMRDTRKRKGGFWVFMRDLVVIVIVALVVSFLVKTFVVRSFYIPSGSMESTLQIQDRILVDELTPRFTGYQRGDIVVFRDPGGWLGQPKPKQNRGPIVEGFDWVLSLVGLSAPDSEEHLIKRIIGLPGDHVTCCNELGQTSVNGVPLDESAYAQYIPMGGGNAYSNYSVKVPEGYLWVLGDNRNNSSDSRAHTEGPTHGFVPIDNVVGRAFVRTWPFDRLGGLGTTGPAFVGVPDPKKTAVPAK